MNKKDAAIVNLKLMDASAEFIARCYYNSAKKVIDDTKCEVCPPKIVSK